MVGFITHILPIVLLIVSTVQGQSTRPINNIPRNDASSVCGRPNPDGSGRPIIFVADAQSSCWYWECRFIRGRRLLFPRNCPLGTAVSSFFGLGSSYPCTEIFNVNAAKFDCTRKKFDLSPDARPQCYRDYIAQGTCKNGGIVRFEYNTCECDCTGTGFADWDCSKRKENLIGADPIITDNDPCPNGIPRINHCQVAGNPCQNNGRCINQCTNYVCQCIPPFTAGRNCETFDCTDNVECLNGGTCSRGPQGTNQFATCSCLPGFTGLMCELIGN